MLCDPGRGTSAFGLDQFLYTINEMRRKITFGIISIAISGLLVALYLQDIRTRVNNNQNSADSNPSIQASNAANDELSQAPTPQEPSGAGDVGFVVNKKNPLPEGYVPGDLEVPNIELRLGRGEEQMQVRTEVARALEQMFVDADNQGVKLVFGSGYRSYELQKTFYTQYSAQSGQAEADKFSARPGHSEHQTGLAVDIVNDTQTCSLEACFAETPEGLWIKQNSHKYGFTVRYQAEWESITGYTYEPWHLRYVGVEISSKLYTDNVPLEQYFGLPVAPEY